MGKGQFAGTGIPKVILMLMKMLTLKQWLEKYGSEPCDGCVYNIPHRAKCTYKKGYCVRYDEYKADQRRPTVEQLELF